MDLKISENLFALQCLVNSNSVEDKEGMQEIITECTWDWTAKKPKLNNKEFTGFIQVHLIAIGKALIYGSGYKGKGFNFCSGVINQGGEHPIIETEKKVFYKPKWKLEYYKDKLCQIRTHPDNKFYNKHIKLQMVSEFRLVKESD